MKPIEPGDRFAVAYGEGRQIEATALSLRQKRDVTRLVEKIQDAGSSEVFDLAEQALRLCVPDITDEQIDKLDELMAMKIVSATMACQRVSEDDQKK